MKRIVLWHIGKTTVLKVRFSLLTRFIRRQSLRGPALSWHQINKFKKKKKKSSQYFRLHNTRRMCFSLFALSVHAPHWHCNVLTAPFKPMCYSAFSKVVPRSTASMHVFAQTGIPELNKAPRMCTPVRLRCVSRYRTNESSRFEEWMTELYSSLFQ